MRIRSIVIVASLCLYAGVQCLAAAGKPNPNVIVVMTDDQGYGDIGAHGNPYLKTPALDRLHTESIRFTDFHVDPTCSPTRAALMTGRYSSRVGVWLTYASLHHLRRGEVTMADVFRQNGYATGIFGKWHLGDNYPFRPMDRDRFDVTSNLLKLPSAVIDAKTTQLKIGDFDESKPVRPGDRAITFRVNLKPGEQRVQSWFTTASGKQHTPYYVYIEPARRPTRRYNAWRRYALIKWE